MSRRWGQHFLFKQNIADKMIKKAEIQLGDQVVEIGSGKGFLTERILSKGAKIKAIEIDNYLCSVLKNKFKSNIDFELLEADIMKINHEIFFSCFKKKPKIIANLPYNISSSLIIKLIPYRHYIKSITIMVQKEVAKRICATNKDPNNFGALSVASGMAFDCYEFFDVSPKSFKPNPKVLSSVIQLFPKYSDLSKTLEIKFLKWSHRLFFLRRKTIINNIKNKYPEWYNFSYEDLKKKYGRKRPENLSINEWIELFNNYQIYYDK